MLAALEGAYVSQPTELSGVEAWRERVGEWIAALMKRLSFDRARPGGRSQTSR